MSNDTRISQDELPPQDDAGADVPPGRFYRHHSGSRESRRIPPHGEVSPDGSRPWPRPSAPAKWLVLGGTVLGAAALTAGTVIAARHVLDMLSGGDDPARPRGSVAPRFADLTPEEREAMRQRARRREAEEDRRAAGLRAEAMQGRTRRRSAPRQSLLQEVEANTASISNGVENIMRAIDSAMLGFRAVASQSSAIMREFGDAADLVEAIIGRKDRRAASPPADTAQDGDATAVDEPDSAPTDGNPRIHRL